MKETAMTGKRVTKRQLQTEANRQYIMNVAQELFSRQGYEKTSMKEISTAARLPIGSLYYHFKNKEDLLLKICVDIGQNTYAESVAGYGTEGQKALWSPVERNRYVW